MTISGLDTNSPIVAAYRTRTTQSARRYAAARKLFPSGVTHDARYILPHPIYVERAKAGRKWDIDGNEYVDYQGGHGALLLGHQRAEVIEAVADQLSRGTHYGASHELEIAWAELVTELIPSAERVRFTSSGTEATMMAVRLARAFTGRAKLIRFRGHFHGWNDHMAFGYADHFDGSPSAGVVRQVAENVLLADPNDGDALRNLIDDHHDIAAAILEPTGSTFGQAPLAEDFLTLLRELTAARGIVLIFDEVVTGFRVSPGGAQAALDIRPDLTTLAKILAGGLPGGAVAGRKDILDGLDHAQTAATGRERIFHPGTFNANLLSAAAGGATLRIVRDEDVCDQAASYAGRLREKLNALFASEGLPWAAYGASSGFHVLVNPDLPIRPGAFDPMTLGFADYKRFKAGAIVTKLRLAMRVCGVDLAGWPGGAVSAAHNEEDLERTVAAFRESIGMLREEGELRA
jgi:glutamate-1-semialdehyde 2,1-aminomutase